MTTTDEQLRQHLIAATQRFAQGFVVYYPTGLTETVLPSPLPPCSCDLGACGSRPRSAPQVLKHPPKAFLVATYLTRRAVALARLAALEVAHHFVTHPH